MIDVKMELDDSLLEIIVTTGFVYVKEEKFNEAASPHHFSYNSNGNETYAEKKKRKEAETNTNKFKQIKLEKKKEARRKKRANN